MLDTLSKGGQQVLPIVLETIMEDALGTTEGNGSETGNLGERMAELQEELVQLPLFGSMPDAEETR